jgi:hypothetical protein
MATAIFILVLLTGYHFIVESIILPDYRLKMRYRLFADRDKLRNLKIEHGHKLSDTVYEELESYINASIRSLSILNIFKFLIIDTEGDIKTEKRINSKIDHIQNCEIKEIRIIFDNISINTLKAMIANIASWFIYLFPFLILAYAIKKICGLALGWKMKLQKFLFTPSHQLDKYFTNNNFSLNS